MPVWEQASTAGSTADTRGLFLFYDQLEYWLAGKDYHNDTTSTEKALQTFFLVSPYSPYRVDGQFGKEHTQLPITRWQVNFNGEWFAAPDLRLITREQVQGHLWVQDIETSRRVTCGGKKASSCLELECTSTCDTDCFTWPQMWSLHKPCVSKRCECHLCSFFKK